MSFAADREQGMAAFKAGAWEQVVAALPGYLQEHPEDYEAGTVLAMAKHRLGKHLEALGDFDRLTLAYPNSASLRYYHGLVLEELKRFKEAEAAYQTALKLRSKHALTMQAIERLQRQSAGAAAPAGAAFKLGAIPEDDDDEPIDLMSLKMTPTPTAVPPKPASQPVLPKLSSPPAAVEAVKPAAPRPTPVRPAAPPKAVPSAPAIEPPSKVLPKPKVNPPAQSPAAPVKAVKPEQPLPAIPLPAKPKPAAPVQASQSETPLPAIPLTPKPVPAVPAVPAIPAAPTVVQAGNVDEGDVIDDVELVDDAAMPAIVIEDEPPQVMRPILVRDQPEIVLLPDEYQLHKGVKISQYKVKVCRSDRLELEALNKLGAKSILHELDPSMQESRYPQRVIFDRAQDRIDLSRDPAVPGKVYSTTQIVAVQLAFEDEGASLFLALRTWDGELIDLCDDLVDEIAGVKLFHAAAHLHRMFGWPIEIKKKPIADALPRFKHAYRTFKNAFPH